MGTYPVLLASQLFKTSNLYHFVFNFIHLLWCILLCHSLCFRVCLSGFALLVLLAFLEFIFLFVHDSLYVFCLSGCGYDTLSDIKRRVVDDHCNCYHTVCHYRDCQGGKLKRLTGICLQI